MNFLAASPILLLIGCVPLHADVVIEEKTEGLKNSGATRMIIKGERARMDTESPFGSTTTFVDKTGTMVNYMHQAKVVFTTSLTDSQKAAKKLIKNAGQPASKSPPLTNTGKSEKVGAWNCEIWEHHTPSASHREWRTKDIPNLKHIQQQMAVFLTLPGMGNDQVPNSEFFTVKTERSDKKGTISTITTRISEEPVPDSDFVTPEGYKEVPIPPQ